MLHLNQRTALLGDKYSGKKQKNADVRTLKVELTEIELDREELNALLGEAHAYEAIYDTSANPVRPYLACIKQFELKSAWEGAHVVLFYSLGTDKVEFKNAKLTKIKIEPRLNAETVMSCVVEGEPPFDRKTLDLIERVGSGIECEIRADRPEEQTDLPLNTHGEGEQPEARGTRKAVGRKRGRGGNGRRPAAH